MYLHYIFAVLPAPLDPREKGEGRCGTPLVSPDVEGQWQGWMLQCPVCQRLFRLEPEPRVWAKSCPTVRPARSGQAPEQ